MDQFSGLSKLRPKGGEMAKPKMDAEPKKEMGAAPESEGGAKIHEIHEHPDGHLETKMHDGTSEQHPDLLHMTTHIAHQMQPEAKHHHSMHDGFSHSTHGVSEDGQHQGTNEHESTDEAANEMKSFMGGGSEEGAEPAPEQEQEHAPMGGM